jgi:hypothetical protein
MTPPALPEPPADYQRLTAFPVVPKGNLPDHVFRVHRIIN